MGSESRVSELPPKVQTGAPAEPPSALRRLLLLLMVTALLAFFSTLGRALIAAQAGWRILPDGSRVRMFSVSHGTRHRAVFPCNTWARHYREIVPKQGWRGILHGSFWSREYGSGGRQTTTPCTMVFFLVGDQVSALSYKAEVDGDDGEIIRAAGRSGNTAASTYFVAGLIFERFPTKRQKVQLRTQLDGQPHTFEITNPAYVP